MGNQESRGGPLKKKWFMEPVFALKTYSNTTGGTSTEAMLSKTARG